jgi:16S rRNA (cytosine1402-N4)-methyltransferase
VDVEHVPVLLRETVELLAPQRGGLFVDCTLGLGGHAGAILEAGPAARVLGIDRDPEALEIAAERLAKYAGRAELVLGNFADVAAILAGRGAEPAAGLLADFGVSSLQLERPERGFSFRRDGPLDMRMGPGGRSAAEIVNRYPEGDLERIFKEYGEERQARRIARALVRSRHERPIHTTAELAALVERVKGRPHPGRPERIDPATQVFQALRIAVNRELEAIEALLAQAANLLAPEGRLVMISYHSLEDRRVKNTLRDLARGEVDQVTGRPRSETRVIELLTRKPIRPGPEDLRQNPRARSARLRAARRL